MMKQNFWWHPGDIESFEQLREVNLFVVEEVGAKKSLCSEQVLSPAASSTCDLLHNTVAYSDIHIQTNRHNKCWTCLFKQDMSHFHIDHLYQKRFSWNFSFLRANQWKRPVYSSWKVNRMQQIWMKSFPRGLIWSGLFCGASSELDGVLRGSMWGVNRWWNKRVVMWMFTGRSCSHSHIWAGLRQ